MTLRHRLRPLVLLGVACLAYLALYLWLQRNVGLVNDEWEWMLYRASSWHGIIDPYNNQPIVGEILFYRLWANVVGVAHHWVVALAYGLMHVGVAALVFVLARRRVGLWPAVGVAVLVLFLGRAWEALMAPPGTTFVLSALAACAAWAVLDRPPRLVRELPTAAVLAVAAVSGGPIPAALGGLVAEVVAGRRWRRSWLVAAGVAPFAAWYVWYLATGGTSEVHTAGNAPHVPLWAVKFLSAAAGATVGLPPAAGPAVIAVAVVTIGLARRAQRPGPLWTPRAIGLVTTLVLAALVTGAARAGDTPPTTSRYLYFPAIVILLLACEAAAGLEVRRPARVLAAAGGALTVVAVALGVQQLRDGKVFYWRGADGTAARMGALRLARGYAPANYAVLEPSRLSYSPAAVERFVRRFGAAPIHTEARLSRALPESRTAADTVLASQLVHLVPPPPTGAGCRPLGPGGALPPGDWTAVVHTSAPTGLYLWRFAEPRAGWAVPLSHPGKLAIRVKSAHIARPWRLAAPGATIAVCP